ncbi:HIRAN domain-containing protein [Olivibacter sitiensis]|uniref:HIRAN domain-containing protein n=1 Tax=Olivibacter sitiensis TaxID=376470 RepID=UPI001B7FE2D2|nr:HIRAN domain-containing protein [Olivibacter sitiensis]
MNRTDFLKSLGLGAGGLVLPSNSFLQTKPVKIYDNYLRGMMHYDFRKIRESIKEGDEVQLFREQDNMYDSFAVQVNFGEYRLGYLAAYENIVIANMLDSGVGLRAYVSQKDLQRHAQEWLAIEVFAELVVPTQKLIDSAC